MFTFRMIIFADAALFDVINQIRNPLGGADMIVGPALGRLGEVVGAVNSQLYAGANTISAMVDGYNHLEKTNPSAPLVKAFTTFEGIFDTTPLLDDPAMAAGQSSQSTPSAQVAQFDPVKQFLGDGRETVNLNELLGSVGGSEGSTGGGLFSGLIGNQGAQNVMSTGTNVLFGLMRQMQGSIGPGSGTDGKLLPAAVSLAQSGLGNAAQFANGQTNVAPIVPVLPLDDRISSNMYPQETLDALMQMYNQNIQPTAANSNYYTSNQGASSSYNQDPPYNSNSYGQQVVQPNVVQPLTGGLLQGGGLGSLIGGITGGLGSTGAGNLLGKIPGKAMEMFSLAQAINSGDSSQMANSVTSILSSAGDVLERVSDVAPLSTNGLDPQAQQLTTSMNAQGAQQLTTSMTAQDQQLLLLQLQLDQVQKQLYESQLREQLAMNGLQDGGSVIGVIDRPRADYLDLEAKEYQRNLMRQIDGQDNGHGSPPVKVASSVDEDSVAELVGMSSDSMIVDKLNETLMGNKASQVEPLPSWMNGIESLLHSNTNAEGRRLKQTDTKTEPCYLVDRNLVGTQLTNMRAWTYKNCQQLCVSSERCRFWTFAPQIALCYMYDVVTGSVYTKHTVSGPKVCPEFTDTKEPETADANDFLLGLAAPVKKIFGGGGRDGGLGSLQRLMVGADGENIVSSVVNASGNDTSTYEVLGNRFADGFTTGGDKLMERMPNVLGGIFGDPEDFKKATASANETIDSRLLPSGVPLNFLARKDKLIQPEEADLRHTAQQISYDQELVTPQLRYPIGGDSNLIAPASNRAPPPQLRNSPSNAASLYGLGNSNTPSSQMVQRVQGQNTNGSFGGMVQNRTTGSSSIVDVFDTSSSVVKAGSKLMDTIPFMDIAKASYQLYNSGLLRKNGIFGGNSTGDKYASLPPANLGFPRVNCTWSGMQCCVPKRSIPRKYKNESISLNGVQADRCQALDYFESDVDELCVTVRFEDSSSSCNSTKFKIEEKLVYQATMEMPGKMNNGLCECILDDGAEMIDSSANWQVNIISLNENKEKELAAEQSAEKLKKSASTAMAWTRMISNAARNVGSATFGDNTVVASSPEQNGPYDPAEMGEGSRWGQALHNLASVKDVVGQARGTVNGFR
eukprot:GHVH01011564.1.p1 GENE.GHVH01011564.1~~GHVH01011564.1.p1  ORF type:complete len:1132 (+),score=150.11 GHVH01011564.1:204-3599(+)